MKKKLLLTLIVFFGILHFSANAQIAGLTCNSAIAVPTLPYATTDNTANYGDTYDITQPSNCITTAGNYMGGNDVFYSYTPTTDESINIKMTPFAGWSGIFVYDGCVNLGVSCVAGVANGSSTIREIPALNVLAGHTYIIAISTFPTPQTVGYTLEIQNATSPNINCQAPTQLSVGTITPNSVSYSWNMTTNSSSWEVIALPCGTAPSSTSTGIITSTNTYTFNGLNASSCYSFYVRAICSATESSSWSTPLTVTTPALIIQPVCGEQFIDNGGINGNYANSSDNIYTICPNNAGDQVTVNFTFFDTEATWDGMYVYNGNSITSPQITSTNPAGNVPGNIAGAFWGNSIPGPFTSTSANGCLTFRFRSDPSVNKPGWVANVICAPAPTCLTPINVSVSNISLDTATVSWTETGTASQWEVLVLPSTAAAPTANTFGTLTSVNPYTITGLTSGIYKVYVRAVCSATDSSLWSNTATFSTTTCIAPSVNSVGNNSSNTTFGWSANNANQWEVLVLAAGSTAPTASSTGTIISTNSYQTSGLACGTTYLFYVRTICNPTTFSSWSVVTFTTANCVLTNGQAQNLYHCEDNGQYCFNLTDNDSNILGTSNAADFTIAYYASQADVAAQINQIITPFCLTNDSATIFVRITNIATQQSQIQTFVVSSQSYSTTVALSNINQCDDNADGIVIFDLTNNAQVTTLNTLTYYTSLVNATNEVNPITNPINYAVSTTVGSATIFIRETIANACDSIYSVQLIANTDCNLAHNCNQANSLCSALGNPFSNTHQGINAESGNNYGCLYTTPNPTWFYLPVSTAGTLNLTIEQSTSINFTSNNLDVDYIVYGPFTNPVSPCSAGLNQSNTVSCSYSAAAVEHPVIPNAQVGEYYLLMTTNFSNQAGFIRITMDPISTGAIDCSGIRLNAFLDSNNNGNQDNGESNFPLGQFHYNINSGTVHNITAPTGIYNIYETNGSNSYNFSYTVDPNYSSMYSISTASYSNVNVIIGGGMVTYNFPITITQSYNDLAVAILPMNAPRAGFNYQNKLYYTNLGNQTISNGTVTFNNSPATSIVSISQAGTNPITNGFTYDFTNLQPFEVRVITVTMAVPSIPTVSIGQLVTNTASIIPISGDVVPENNSYSSTEHIIAAYDPNDKMESHGDKIIFSGFNANDYLYYTIRFENTGSVSAINVSINDVLDAQLDESTVQVVTASHNYTMDRVGNGLTWNFNNIQLPVSVPETQIGKGFVTFKVKLKPGFAVGDIIPNTASIFFDTNPAIITNTFLTEFVSTLSNNSFTDGNFNMYPNPSHTSVQINLQNASEQIEKIIIYDVLGKIIKTQSAIASNLINLDVSNLPKGIYLVEITTDSNLRTTKKLVIN